MIGSVLLTAAMATAQPWLADDDRDAVPAIFEEVMGTDPGEPQAPTAGATILAAGMDSHVYVLVSFTDFEIANVSRVRFEVALGNRLPAYDISALLAFGRPYLSSDGQTLAVLLDLPRSFLLQTGPWALAAGWYEGGTRPYSSTSVTLRQGAKGLVGIVAGLRGGNPVATAHDWEVARPPRWFWGHDSRWLPPVPLPEECEQGLRQIEGPVYMVEREQCVPALRGTCVPDCGDMIGTTVIFLDRTWG